MNLVGPLLVLGYFGAQYTSATQNYAKSMKSKRSLPVGLSGEPVMTRGEAARYRGPVSGTTTFKPIEHPDWARVQARNVYRQRVYERQSGAKAGVVSSGYHLDPVRVARNLPPGMHLLDWPGTGRFSWFTPDRQATALKTARDPETKAMYDAGRAKYTRADLRVGGS